MTSAPAADQCVAHTRGNRWVNSGEEKRSEEGEERELKEIRVCSLHFPRSDYGRDPYVSSLLGHAATRRRLMYTAVPSVVLPGQPEYSERSDSHLVSTTNTSFGV